LPESIWLPGAANSSRNNMDKVVPTTPENAPNNKYNVPMSL
jgi:hypothetical protein